MPESKESPAGGKRSPANRLGLDYRAVPPRKVSTPIIDFHTHVVGVDEAAVYFQVADAYGISEILSMTPLDQVDEMRRRYPDRLEFIAVPKWKDIAATDEFERRWIADLEGFRDKGSHLCKLWMAPRIRKELGLTLDHPMIRNVAGRAHEMGFHFMIHIADPTVWWEEKYRDVAVYGTKDDQYDPLRRFLADFSDRTVVGAHMGGSVEKLDRLQGLFDQFDNFVVDSSATKWIVREVARNRDATRAFIIKNADRILFGSDVVVGAKYDFEHYASRYWTHQMMWETAYDGESPIEDPDAADPPPLKGLDLPEDVLIKFYRGNAERILSRIRGATGRHTA